MAKKEYSDAPLSPYERKMVRRMIEREERFEWLIILSKNTAGYLVVILGAAAVSWEWLLKIVKGAAK